ncbi:hypothetical protein Ae717Ps2_5798c [Pseudonocardia sp. Ae717_Ps2]|nr:hypothetical protein Ae717Ps2_5798c [Pseudonocardia sp. Ae717_Ps2]
MHRLKIKLRSGRAVVVGGPSPAVAEFVDLEAHFAEVGADDLDGDGAAVAVVADGVAGGVGAAAVGVAHGELELVGAGFVEADGDESAVDLAPQRVALAAFGVPAGAHGGLAGATVAVGLSWRWGVGVGSGCDGGEEQGRGQCGGGGQPGHDASNQGASGGALVVFRECDRHGMEVDHGLCVTGRWSCVVKAVTWSGGDGVVLGSR